MAFYRLVIPILVLSVVYSTASEVPVYVWGDLPSKSLNANPLTTVKASDFKEILKKELQDDPFTVVFIEETLSVEDFSRRDNGGTSFPYLRENVKNSLYFPSVANALPTLKFLADPDQVDEVKLTENGLSAEITPEAGKFLFIKLKDAQEGESRSELLLKHDNFMRKTIADLKRDLRNVVAIYTAHYPSWTIPQSHSRVRRQAVSRAQNITIPGMLFYADSISIGNTSLGSITANSMALNISVLDITLTFGADILTFDFTMEGGYWFLNYIIANQTARLTSDTEIYAIEGFSYRCKPNITFSDNSTAITFSNLKIQPFFDNSTDHQFGDSLNCVGFFSAPIWSGLFVVFILLAITFYGIMMMMDIRTMDRFDDPKGKTITISATD